MTSSVQKFLKIAGKFRVLVFLTDNLDELIQRRCNGFPLRDCNANCPLIIFTDRPDLHAVRLPDDQAANHTDAHAAFHQPQQFPCRV